MSVAEVRAVVGYMALDERTRRVTAFAPIKRDIGSYRPGAIEVSRWADLLDYEAKLRAPEPVPIFVPKDVSETSKVVAEDIALFLGLRDQAGWRGKPFTFTWRFAAARCELGEHATRSALRELITRGVIVKKRGERRHWQPQMYGLGIPPDATPDALMALMAYTFDATEVANEMNSK